MRGKVVYATYNAVAFAIGLAAPLFAPNEDEGAYHPLADLLGSNPLALVVALVLVAGASAATGFVTVHVGRRHSRVQRALIKWFIMFLPPLAAGHVAAMALGMLGSYELSPNYIALLAVSATSFAFAAIARIAVLRSTPEYHRS